MRKSVLSVLLLVLCADATSAADKPPPRARRYQPPPAAYVPPPEPVIPVRTDTWRGFYFGANGGGALANTTSDFSVGGGAPFASAKNSMSGGFGGVQAGYNWQNGAIVLGIEADFQFAGINGSINAPPCPAAVCGVATSASYSQNMPWFGTARGRIGYGADTWLIYGTGGYAYGRLKTDATATAGPVTAVSSREENRSGWAAGGGIEVALDRRWSARVEYLYLDLGSRDGNLVITGIPTITDRIRLYENLVRAGVNFRF